MSLKTRKNLNLNVQRPTENTVGRLKVLDGLSTNDKRENDTHEAINTLRTTKNLSGLIAGSLSLYDSSSLPMAAAIAIARLRVFRGLF